MIESLYHLMIHVTGVYTYQCQSQQLPPWPCLPWSDQRLLSPGTMTPKPSCLWGEEDQQRFF